MRMNYLQKLSSRGITLRPARTPNPVERVDSNAVRVHVLRRDKSVRCTFLVDADVYEELVAPYRWNVGARGGNRVYTSGRKPDKSNATVLLARWLLDPPVGMEVDHINENPLDNRLENLRVVTRKQNEENKNKPRGKSRYRGVHFCKQTDRWRAEVMSNYRRHKSPRFDTEEEANAWAVAKRAELFTHHQESA